MVDVKKVLSVFLIIALISLFYVYKVNGQDSVIIAGKYVHTIGTHGSTEALLFQDDKTVILSRKTLTRPTSMVCYGRYQIIRDTISIDFTKKELPFSPTYKIVRKINHKQFNDKVAVHLNVFIKRIVEKNESNLNELAEYDSVTNEARFTVEVVDKSGKSIEFNSFSSKAILKLSRDNTLIVTTAGAFGSQEISLNDFEYNEIFMELIAYERFDLPCSTGEKKFYIRELSPNTIRLESIESGEIKTYYKNE